MKNITLSVLIPVYNEEKIIVDTLNKISSFLKSKRYIWEIVVVDDGSKDKTVENVKKQNFPHVRLVTLAANKGKGGALREGVAAAEGDYILFMDADLSVPIATIDPFLETLQKGDDVVIGSRRVKGAKIVKHQKWLRETMGRIFTFLSRIVTDTYLSDFTCGFKGFEKNAAKKIFGKSLIDRWVFDAEILFLAHKFGYTIKEFPVEWVNREDSRIISLGGTGYKSFLELLQIRYNDLTGKYD